MSKKDFIKKYILYNKTFIYACIAQLLSALLFVCTVCSDQLAEIYKIDIPTLQTFPAYILLLVICGCYSIVKKNTIKLKTIKSNWIKYLFYAIFDVEANFIIITSFKYTSPASVQLLDASIIPIVIVLSLIVFKTRYNIFHYIGALLTVVGAVSLVIIDVRKDFSEFTRGKNPLLGDLLVVVASILYAFSNLIAESLTEGTSCCELILFQSLFASFITLIQGLCLEYTKLKTSQWNHKTFLFIGGYTISLTVFYLLIPSVIRYIKASGFNISIVTSDIYTIIYSSLIYKSITPLYSIGAIIITIGCLLFHAQTLFIDYKNNRDSNNLNVHTVNSNIV